MDEDEIAFKAKQAAGMDERDYTSSLEIAD